MLLVGDPKIKAEAGSFHYAVVTACARGVYSVRVNKHTKIYTVPKNRILPTNTLKSVKSKDLKDGMSIMAAWRDDLGARGYWPATIAEKGENGVCIVEWDNWPDYDDAPLYFNGVSSIRLKKK